MNTNIIKVTHLESPEDEKILDLLKNFQEKSEDGFLRLETADLVFVIAESDAHKKIKISEGQALPMGEIEVDGVRFAQYSVNKSFFES